MIEPKDYHGNCEELKSVFFQVYESIPSEDRAKIDEVCSRIEFLVDPNMPGDHWGACYLPDVIEVDTNYLLERSAAKQRAVFAHELGHARDRFDNPLVGLRNPEETPRAERAASTWAVKWGYREDLIELYGREPTQVDPE